MVIVTVGGVLIDWQALRTKVHRSLPPALVALEEHEHAIVFAGDTMTWDRTAQLLHKYGAHYPFEATALLLQQADLTVLNLEGPIAERAARSKEQWSYRVPPWTLAGLRRAGVDQVSLANNHLYDCGEAGVNETLRHLGAYGIGAFGLQQSDERSLEPRVVTVGSAQVALLGFVAAETLYPEAEDAPASGEDPGRLRQLRDRLGPTQSRLGAAIATVQSVRRAVEHAASVSDLVVLFIHFGVRYHRPPTAFQRRAAEAAIDAGASLVVGHHAHFWQPVGVHRGRPIVFSTGNFAFGSGNRRADEGLIVRAVLTGKRLDRVELFPLFIKNRDPTVRYQPKVMRGASARDLLTRLAAASAQLGAQMELEEVAPGAVRGVVRLASDTSDQL